MPVMIIVKQVNKAIWQCCMLHCCYVVLVASYHRRRWLPWLEKSVVTRVNKRL